MSKIGLKPLQHIFIGKFQNSTETISDKLIKYITIMKKITIKVPALYETNIVTESIE